MKQQALKALGTGLVALHVAARQPSPSPGEVIKTVAAGADFEELTVLRQELDLPMEQLAAKLGFSRATLHRRKTSGRLTSDESDKIVRYARLLGQATRIFDGAEDARQWLKTPQRGLGGAIPLDYARTETGAREVEKLLGRIDYGVYS